MSNRVTVDQVQKIARRLLEQRPAVTTAQVREAVFGSEQGYDHASVTTVFEGLWGLHVRGELDDGRDGPWRATGVAS